MAKGAGMIHPDMATMLAFMATDAPIATPLLRDIVREVADVSFNGATLGTFRGVTAVGVEGGAAKDDVMIGGSLALDQTALRIVLGAWAGNGTYESRVGTLRY